MLDFTILLFAIFITPGPITMLVIRNSLAGYRAVVLTFYGLVLATSLHAIFVWVNIHLLRDLIEHYRLAWMWAGVIFLSILCLESFCRFTQSSIELDSKSTNVRVFFLSGFGLEFTNPAGLAYYAFIFPKYAGIELELNTYGLYFVVQVLIVAIVFSLYFLGSRLIFQVKGFTENLRYMYLFSAVVFAIFAILAMIETSNGST